jgi:DNA repair ATPase RecN
VANLELKVTAAEGSTNALSSSLASEVAARAAAEAEVEGLVGRLAAEGERLRTVEGQMRDLEEAAAESVSAVEREAEVAGQALQEVARLQERLLELEPLQEQAGRLHARPLQAGGAVGLDRDRGLARWTGPATGRCQRPRTPSGG